MFISQSSAGYRIPTAVSLLPVGTPKADTQVFCSPIINDTQWAYLVWLPPTCDAAASKVWPTLICIPAYWYNGSGGNANDFATSIDNDGGPAKLLLTPTKYKTISDRFIVVTLFTQWEMVNSRTGKPVLLHSLLDYVVKQAKIDTTRITMMGYVYGSGICYTYAAAYPKGVSHLVLMAGNDNWSSTFDLTKACALKNIPIRQYADSLCAEGPYAKAAYDAIMACGGRNDSLAYTHTTLDEVWHYGGYDTLSTMYDWMLSGNSTLVAPEINADKINPMTFDNVPGKAQTEVVDLNGKVLMRFTGNESSTHRFAHNRGAEIFLVRTSRDGRFATRVMISK
jgi:hypothetical protein